MDYACPHCKRPVRADAAGLRCPACGKTYPIADGIPDFLGEDLARSADPELRRMRFIDRMARIYETPLWYPIVLKLFGGLRSPTPADLIRIAAADVRGVEGRVLDVACGPGTFGRRVASPLLAVFGIDVSMGMLRQGAAYAAQEGVSERFARARVEALPFEDAVFDAVLCCGSLHLFTDTLVALREIARVMKPHAVLSTFTFGAGRGGLLRFRRMREWYRRNHGLHVFDLSELKADLSLAGLSDFRPRLDGSILTFSARKGAAGEIYRSGACS
jgi:SAM-dependent methyltransferase